VDVAQAEADERLQRLQALLRAQQAEVQESMVGREVGVLFEKPGRLPGQMVGKSDYLHAVHVQTDAPIGSLARVRIVDSGSNSLAGEIVDKPD
jgi:tRNA-2-methylthio-N6-dimethylallyladenosine synthase